MPEYLDPGVYVEEFELGPKSIEGVGTSTVGFVGLTCVGPKDTPTLITSWNEFVRDFGRYDRMFAPYLPPAVYGFFANGGKRCYVVRAKDEEGLVGVEGGPGNSTGLNALGYIDEVSIVCTPGATSVEVQQKIIDHCESLENRFAVLDMPKDADIDTVKDQRSDLFSGKGYAALYHPWVEVAKETVDAQGEVTENVDKFFPPSGYVAGVYARTDVEKGVHNAPANEVLRDVTGLRFNITKNQQEILHREGINCIRKFPVRGIRVWGARTISRDPEWKYVNVRRLLIYLEQSISKGTQWVIFEPNGEPLWEKVRRSITQFLTKLWRDRALTGTKPEEAFFVKCDRTTMSQYHIDNGRLICEIGVDLLQPSEFVIFRIVQKTAVA